MAIWTAAHSHKIWDQLTVMSGLRTHYHYTNTHWLTWTITISSGVCNLCFFSLLLIYYTYFTPQFLCSDLYLYYFLVCFHAASKCKLCHLRSPERDVVFLKCVIGELLPVCLCSRLWEDIEMTWQSSWGRWEKKPNFKFWWCTICRRTFTAPYINIDLPAYHTHTHTSIV
jgi:hypothetical protein